MLAWTPRSSAVASSGLEDISADLVAPKLSLQRQLMGVEGFASRFAAAQTADARPCAAGTLPVGQGPPPSLQGGARVWHVPRGDARWRVGGPPPTFPRSRAAADRPTRLGTRPSGLLPSPSLQDGGCGRPRDWRAGSAPGRAGWGGAAPPRGSLRPLRAIGPCAGQS